MNIKKYRAATTREALEQVKQDLGEDAFVLETRKINSGGFLGLQKEIQIEISAASPAILAASKTESRESPALNGERLILQDNSPAFPVSAEFKKQSTKDKIMNAISARAVSSESLKNDLSIMAQTQRANAGKASTPDRSEIETVEISPKAPRIVHQKKDSIKAKDSEQKPNLAEAKESSSEVIGAKRELELLRAELREVKYSISTLSANQTVLALQNGNGLEEFTGEFTAPFYESFVELLSTGIRPELTRQVVAENIPQFEQNSNDDERLTEKILMQVIADRVKFEFSPLQKAEPKTLALIGTTGVGKTTTIAKLAARASLHKNCRVELVTLDTYRIAAVEQLKTYAEIIGAGCHVVRSVFELDAVLRRLPSESTVLIDTTGKSPHDLADQHELSDYLHRRKEIRKCLAIQANTDPIDALLTISKFEMYGADSLILTKMDETVRPGAMIEVVSESSLPLAYICMGQRVPEDLRIATPQEFAAQILRKNITQPGDWQ